MAKFSPTYPMTRDIVIERILFNKIAQSASRLSNCIKLLREDINLLTKGGSQNATKLNTISSKLK